MEDRVRECWEKRVEPALREAWRQAVTQAAPVHLAELIEVYDLFVLPTALVAFEAGVAVGHEPAGAGGGESSRCATP